MKKWFKILLVVLALTLIASVFAACDDDKKPTPTEQKYTITFDSKAGDYVDPITAAAGEDISALLPEDPSKSGVYFGGWSKEDNGFASRTESLPEVMPAENVTYYARWVVKFTIVPQLQNLDENGQPVSDAYTEAPDLGQSFEADPDHPTVDLYDYIDDIQAGLVGFAVELDPDDSTVKIDMKDKTVPLKFSRKAYRISFNSGHAESIGEMAPVTAFYGQRLTLPECTFTYPDDLRFSGWATDHEGVNFVLDGDELEIGGAGSIIDGKTSTVMLYAIYDEGYFNFSRSEDYLFIPAHEQGVAVIRRMGLEMEGTYLPGSGEFFIDNDAGTQLHGKAYADGHFAYQINTLTDDYFNETYTGIVVNGGYFEGVLAGTQLTISDKFGAATLTLGQDKNVVAIDEYYSPSMRTLRAGTYQGTFWMDDLNDDMCFSLLTVVSGSEMQLDVHFKIYTYNNNGTPAPGFGMRGEEAGLYCESVVGNELLGDLIMLDGYGAAIYVADDSQAEGEYVVVDGNVLLGVTGDDDSYTEILMSPDKSTMYGISTMYLPIMTYRVGDSALLANCENTDASGQTTESFVSDGFGAGTYTDAQGKATQGVVTLGGDVYDATTPAIVYVLTDEAGKKLSFIVDQNTPSGNFIVVDGEVELTYIYNRSALSDEYVGAIVKQADGTAYFLTAAFTSNNTVVFTEPVKGAVTSSEGSLFEGGGYILSYEADEQLTEENGILTAVTAQVQLGAVAFGVKDAQNRDAGTLTVDASHKATYVPASGDGFEALDCEFLYGALHIADGNDSLFIVDSFGEQASVRATTKRTVDLAGEDEPVGELYEFYGGVMFWGYNDEGQLRFINYGEMLSTEEVATQQLAIPSTVDDADVYVVMLVTNVGFCVIEEENGNYLSSNGSDLDSGRYTLTGGASTLELDEFGRLVYTETTVSDGQSQNSDPVYGTYALSSAGVYKATLDSEFSFKFALNGGGMWTFAEYEQYYVINPETLSVAYLIRLFDTDNAATLTNARSNNGSITLGEQTTGTVADLGDGVYSFTAANAEEAMFSFYFSDVIMTTRVACMSVASMQDGTFDGYDGDSIKLDKLGRGTYTDSEGTVSEGFYFRSGNRYRFVSNDEQTDFNFEIIDGALSIYDPNRPAQTEGDYTVTIKDKQYDMHIDFVSHAVTLSAEGVTPASGTASVDSDGIYAVTLALDGHDESLKFIVSGKNIVFYNEAFDLEFSLVTGNIYLYSAEALESAGTLRIKGFLQVAELEIAEGVTLHGSVEYTQDVGYKFVAEDGSTQDFEFIDDGDEYLIALGAECGDAYQMFITLSSFGQDLVRVAYFDGKGAAYEYVGNERVLLGYYIFSYNPYAIADDGTLLDEGTYIDVIGVDDQGYPLMSETSMTIVAVYKPYGQYRLEYNNETTYVVGVMPYDPTMDTTVIADDGSVIYFNGFDEVLYYDSLGVMHEGYFNNYGLMFEGAEDNTYVIMDLSGGITLFELEINGSQMTARRINYLVQTPYSGVEAEVQIFRDPDAGSYDDAPEGAQGVAVVVVYLGNESAQLAGYYTIEGGYMIIYVEMLDGTTETLELMLYVDGVADWLDVDEWLGSEGE